MSDFIHAVNIEKRESPKFDLRPYMLRDDEDERFFRFNYGVAIADTFSFDSFLLHVFANGLDILAKTAHSWPGMEPFPTFESWVGALNKQADNARWLIDFDDKEHDLFYEYHKVPKDIDEVFELLNNEKLEPEAQAEYDARNAVLVEEREKRKDELLDFIKEWFWALWD